MDEARNLAVCPLLHAGNFMQLFYEGGELVQQFLAADAQLPPEVALPRPPMRQVARMLADRRDYPALQVVAHLEPLAQPELLDTEQQQAQVVVTRGDSVEMNTVVAPEPRVLGKD
jgi:hypothetical protein